MFYLMGKVPTIDDIQRCLTTIIKGNVWSILPWRLGEGKSQFHKGRELAMFLMLVGLNVTGHLIATLFLMASEGRALVPLMTAAITSDGSPLLPLLPKGQAAQEFLLLGLLPAILCHLVSCCFLVCYYRCSHTWREIGSDINCRRCCCCCYSCCCPSIGRLWSQKNPITGEIPFWEKVGDRKIRFCFEYDFSGGEERGQPGSDGDITTCNKGEIPFLQKDQRTKSFR